MVGAAPLITAPKTEMAVVREFDDDSRDGGREDSPGSWKSYLNVEYFGGGRSPSESASRKVSISVLLPRRGMFGVVVAARRRLRDDLAVFPRKLEVRCGEDCGCSGGGSDVAMGTSRSDVVRQSTEAGSMRAGILRAKSKGGQKWFDTGWEGGRGGGGGGSYSRNRLGHRCSKAGGLSDRPIHTPQIRKNTTKRHVKRPQP